MKFLRSLYLSRPLRVAADNLDLLRGEFSTSIGLKLDVLHKERPNVVAEPVGLEMALECESSPDFLGENIGDILVEVAKYPHGKLWFDSAIVD